MNPGEIGFTKSLMRRGSDWSDFLEMKLIKGYEYVVLVLGKIQKGKKIPDEDVAIGLLHGMGFVLYDEVEEVLGEEACEKLLEAMNKKVQKIEKSFLKGEK